MKNLFLIIIFLFASAFTVYSADDDNTENKDNENDEITEAAIPQTPEKKRSDIWFSLGGDGSMYSYEGFSYGGSFAFGVGSGSAIGFKASYFFSQEGLDTLEVCLLLRFYFKGKGAYSGPFLQFLGGASLFNRSSDFAIPANTGIFSAGLGFGWRFLFADRFFIEPYIRGGYPYIVGAAFSAGIRF